jgi:hypothetical protein
MSQDVMGSDTNEEKALAATAFSPSISLMHCTQSHIIQSGVAGGDSDSRLLAPRFFHANR